MPALQGFESLLEALDDIMLDVPSAPDLMALFICRAVVDDVLPPSFVGSVASGKRCSRTRARWGRWKQLLWQAQGRALCPLCLFKLTRGLCSLLVPSYLNRRVVFC